MKSVNLSGRIALIVTMLLLAQHGVASAFKATEIPEVSMRVKVRRVGGAAVTPEARFKLSFTGSAVIEFNGGEWSAWATLKREALEKGLESYPNSYNRQPQARFMATVAAVGKSEYPLYIDVETRLEGGEVSTMVAELINTSLGILVWRIGKEGELHIDTLAGYGRRVHAAAMEAAALAPENRPQKIVFGDRYIGGDGDAICQREGISRLCGLGFNAMHAVPRQFLECVRDGGISNLWGAVYSPPGYAFNFATNRHEVFREFVKKQVQGAINAGWERDEIVLWVTSDEPGWYYPAQYKSLNNDPLAMADFHSYLQQNGLKPKMLGAKRWSDVHLIGRKEYQTLGERRLYYWSNRFVPWASSRFFAEVTRAYEAELGEGFPIMVNFNNFMGRLYQPGAVGNNRDKKDPNAAMGQHDWLEFGRLRGSTCIATEDWFGDAMAPQWSFYATRLRSAGDYSGVGFGSLVIPRTSGQRPEGMAQKLLALVGQGAKNIKFFTFGPEYNFPQNCYDYNTAVYQPLSLGMGLVGRAEELLYPGRLATPEVALLMPQSAQLWDLEEMEVASGLMDVTNTDLFQGRMAYEAETYGLHLALQHSAIAVQAIDEESCISGRKDLGRFKVIYVTAPDLPQEAAAELLRWVRRGGTLVLTAGSGLFDRYHQPLAALSKAAGVVPENTVRPLLRGLGGIQESGKVVYGHTEATCFGEREKLTVGKATTLANFEDGTAALTANELGRGRVIRFAMFPGVCYRKSAGENIGGLPGGFTPLWRELITTPVREGGVVTPVEVDRSLIEAHALQSERGVALTLLNWSGAAQEGVKIVIRTGRLTQRVESVRKGELPFQTSEERSGNYTHSTVITLDMTDVDVLKIW